MAAPPEEEKTFNLGVADFVLLGLEAALLLQTQRHLLARFLRVLVGSFVGREHAVARDGVRRRFC